MDNRQHGLKRVEISKQSKFSKWFNKFFGVGQKKEAPKVNVMRPWQQGGGYGFGGTRSRTISAKVLADWNKPRLPKRSKRGDL